MYGGGLVGDELVVELLDVLARSQLIGGPVGAVAAMHGGSIELVDVSVGDEERRVDVTMKGACRGCPAAIMTLHQRLERQLSLRLREPVTVREI